MAEPQYVGEMTDAEFKAYRQAYDAKKSIQTGEPTVDPFEAVSENWVGPKPQDIAATKGYYDYRTMVEKNKEGQRGLWEELTDPELAEVPFIGGFAAAPAILSVAMTARKLNNGEEVTDDELVNFNYFLEFQKRKENASKGAHVADVVQNSLSFVTEIAAALLFTGGAGLGLTAGKAGGKKALIEIGEQAGKKGAYKMAQESAEKVGQYLGKGIGKSYSKVSGRLAKKVGKEATAKAMQEAGEASMTKMGNAGAKFFSTAVDAHYAQKGIFKSIGDAVEDKTVSWVGKHMSKKAAGILGKGAKIGATLTSKATAIQLLTPDNTMNAYAQQKIADALQNKDQTEAIMIGKAILDMNIEYASEFSGEYIGKAFSALGNKYLKDGVLHAMYTWGAKKFNQIGAGAVARSIKAMGVDNVLEEMAEERAGDFMRGLLGVHDTPSLKAAFKGLIPSFDQFTTEAIAFSVMPIGAYAMDRATGGASIKQRETAERLLKPFIEQEGQSTTSENEWMSYANALIPAMQAEGFAPYKDIKGITEVLGTGKRGGVRTQLEGIERSLADRGIAVSNLLGTITPDSTTEEKIEAAQNIAKYMALATNVHYEGLTKKQSKQLNAGIESEQIKAFRWGMQTGYAVQKDWMDKKDVADFAGKANLHVVENFDNLERLQFGEISSEVLTSDWANLKPSGQKKAKALLGIYDQKEAEARWDYLYKVSKAPGFERFTADFMMPVILVDTAAAFSEKGYPIGGNEKPFETREDGEPLFARFINGTNNAKGELSTSPFGSNHAFAEEIVETSYKMMHGGELGPKVEAYLDELEDALIRDQYQENSFTPLDDMNLTPRSREVERDIILRRLKNADGRREVWSKTAVMNYLGGSALRKTYAIENELYARLPMPEHLQEDLISTVGKDVLDALSLAEDAEVNSTEIVTTSPAEQEQEVQNATSNAVKNAQVKGEAVVAADKVIHSVEKKAKKKARKKTKAKKDSKPADTKRTEADAAKRAERRTKVINDRVDNFSESASKVPQTPEDQAQADADKKFMDNLVAWQHLPWVSQLKEEGYFIYSYYEEDEDGNRIKDADGNEIFHAGLEEQIKQHYPDLNDRDAVPDGLLYRLPNENFGKPGEDKFRPATKADYDAMEAAEEGSARAWRLKQVESYPSFDNIMEFIEGNIQDTMARYDPLLSYVRSIAGNKASIDPERNEPQLVGTSADVLARAKRESGMASMAEREALFHPNFQIPGHMEYDPTFLDLVANGAMPTWTRFTPLAMAKWAANDGSYDSKVIEDVAYIANTELVSKRIKGRPTSASEIQGKLYSLRGALNKAYTSIPYNARMTEIDGKWVMTDRSTATDLTRFELNEGMLEAEAQAKRTEGEDTPQEDVDQAMVKWMEGLQNPSWDRRSAYSQFNHVAGMRAQQIAEIDQGANETSFRTAYAAYGRTRIKPVNRPYKPGDTIHQRMRTIKAVGTQSSVDLAEELAAETSSKLFNESSKLHAVTPRKDDKSDFLTMLEEMNFGATLTGKQRKDGSYPVIMTKAPTNTYGFQYNKILKKGLGSTIARSKGDRVDGILMFFDSEQDLEVYDMVQQRQILAAQIGEPVGTPMGVQLDMSVDTENGTPGRTLDPSEILRRIDVPVDAKSGASDGNMNVPILVIDVAKIRELKRGYSPKMSQQIADWITANSVFNMGISMYDNVDVDFTTASHPDYYEKAKLITARALKTAAGAQVEDASAEEIRQLKGTTMELDLASLNLRRVNVDSVHGMMMEAEASDAIYVTLGDVRHRHAPTTDVYSAALRFDMDTGLNNQPNGEGWIVGTYNNEQEQDRRFSPREFFRNLIRLNEYAAEHPAFEFYFAINAETLKHMNTSRRKVLWAIAQTITSDNVYFAAKDIDVLQNQIPSLRQEAVTKANKSLAEERDKAWMMSYHEQRAERKRFDEAQVPSYETYKVQDAMSVAELEAKEQAEARPFETTVQLSISPEEAAQKDPANSVDISTKSPNWNERDVNGKPRIPFHWGPPSFLVVEPVRVNGTITDQNRRIAALATNEAYREWIEAEDGSGLATAGLPDDQARRSMINQNLHQLQGKTLYSMDSESTPEMHGMVLVELLQKRYGVKTRMVTSNAALTRLPKLAVKTIATDNAYIGANSGATFNNRADRMADRSDGVVAFYMRPDKRQEKTPDVQEAWAVHNTLQKVNKIGGMARRDAVAREKGEIEGQKIVDGYPAHRIGTSHPTLVNPTAEELAIWLRTNEIENLLVLSQTGERNRIAQAAITTIRQANEIGKSTEYVSVPGETVSGLGSYKVSDAWPVASAVALTDKSDNAYQGVINDMGITETDIILPVRTGKVDADQMRRESSDVEIQESPSEPMALKIQALSGAKYDQSTVMKTDRMAIDQTETGKLLSVGTFQGPIEFGQHYVLVSDSMDDGSIAALRGLIESHGAFVKGVIVGGGSTVARRLQPTEAILNKLIEKDSYVDPKTKKIKHSYQEILNEYGIAPSFTSLTQSQAKHVASFVDAAAFEASLASIIDKHYSREVGELTERYYISSESGRLPDEIQGLIAKDHEDFAQQLASFRGAEIPENMVDNWVDARGTGLIPSMASYGSIFDGVVPVLFDGMSELTEDAYEIQEVIAELRERFIMDPHGQIEAIETNELIDAPARAEAVALLNEAMTDYYPASEQAELSHSMAMSNEFLRYSDIWMYGGSAGLKEGFVEQNRNMNAEIERISDWANNLRNDVGLYKGNKKIPKESRQLVASQAKLMLRALKHRIDNPNATMIITNVTWKGERFAGGAKKYEYSSNLDPIDVILRNWDAIASEFNLSDSQTVEKKIKEMNEMNWDKGNTIVNGLTPEEWIGYVDHYMRHSYMPRVDREYKEYMRVNGTEASISKSRKFDTFEEAAHWGFIPKDEDAISNTVEAGKILWRKARDKTVLNAGLIMKTRDGAPVMLPSFDDVNASTLMDEKSIKMNLDNLVAYARGELDTAISYDPLNEVKEEYQKVMGQISSTKLKLNGFKRVETPLLSGVNGIFVQEGPAENMVRYIDASRWNNKAATVMENLNHWMKWLSVSFSLFHAVALMESFVAFRGLNMANPILPWNWKEAVKNYKELNARMESNPEFKYDAIRNGLQFKTTSPDVDVGGKINTDLSNTIDRLGSTIADSKSAIVKRSAESLRTGLKGLLTAKKFMDNLLWSNLHSTLKLSTYEYLNAEGALKMDRDLTRNEKQHIAQQVNMGLGGIEFERLAWTNPKTLQALHFGLFAPDWTMAAAGIGGMGKLMGFRYSDMEVENMLKKYWPAMFGFVLIGIPAATQGVMYLAAGDPDEGDEMFPWQNEPGRKGHIDLTPIARNMPWYDGSPTDKRRVFMRFGKQAYEVFDGWLTKPADTFLNKTSHLVKSTVEQMTGRNVLGWELGFHDKSFLGGLLKGRRGFLDSRVGTQAQHFMPMWMSTALQGKGASIFVPIASGASQTAIIKRMQEAMMTYAYDPDAWEKNSKGVTVKDVVVEAMDAARDNGYNEDMLFRTALRGIQSRYGAEMFYALNKNKTDEMEQIANRLKLLDVTLADMISGQEWRYKRVNRTLGAEDRTQLQMAYNQ